MLYREPMWLKCALEEREARGDRVSVLYREPMWLKCTLGAAPGVCINGFQCSTVSRCG